MFGTQENHWFEIEKPTPFARSTLWELQRTYFNERGSGAWRDSEVPHYVTSNPSMANCYAEMAFALLQDQPGKNGEPLTICELGGGSGRFAFHFLQRLKRLCELGDVPFTAFRYILTDYADSNLDAWEKHPSFRPFFASGVLDVAHFDVNLSSTLKLRRAGQEITPGSLQQPLVVLANYLFDSVPQDLYYLKDGELQLCLLALEINGPPGSFDNTALLQNLRCLYTYRAPQPDELPAEPELAALLQAYQHSLHDTHLLFPTAGLRCLARLKALSVAGLLLLSADKGELQLQSLENLPPPEPERHGSFSLQVNYHALLRWCEEQGGLPLTPAAPTAHVGVCGLLMTLQPEACRATRLAFRRHAQDFSPDDFYTISLHARTVQRSLAVDDMLAHLRMSHYDAHFFGICMPRLLELCVDASPAERDQLAHACQQVWKNYFPLGEVMDLADNIAYLLYQLELFELALLFYERSAAAYGQRTGVLYNRALCLRALGDFSQAAALASAVLAEEPDNAWALELLQHCEAAGACPQAD